MEHTKNQEINELEQLNAEINALKQLKEQKQSELAYYKNSCIMYTKKIQECDMNKRLMNNTIMTADQALKVRYDNKDRKNILELLQNISKQIDEPSINLIKSKFSIFNNFCKHNSIHIRSICVFKIENAKENQFINNKYLHYPSIKININKLTYCHTIFDAACDYWVSFLT